MQIVLFNGTVPGDGTGAKGQTPWNAFNSNSTDLYQKAAFFGVDSGAANAYVVAYSTLQPQPAVAPTLTAGIRVRFIPLHPSTTAATLNFAGTGPVAIVNLLGAALTGAEMQTQPIEFMYNGSAWQIMSPSTSALLGELLYPQTAAETAAGVTPTYYFYPPGNVLRYGADPTGVASSYTAFLNAVAVCTQTGVPVTVPAGQYNLPTSNPAIACAFVTFQGAGVAKGSSIDAAGSVLNFTGATTTNSAFSIGPGVSFYGIGFYYPAQVDSATPIAFAPTIVTNLTNGPVNFVYIQNCVVWNAYRFFVNADATGAIGHVFILDNTIYGILTCIEISYNSEIVTIQGNEFTFGHYLVASETGLRLFTRANGTVLLQPRTDGLQYANNVHYGYLNGIKCVTAGQLVQLTTIAANYFDNVLNSIVVSGTGNISAWQIVGNTIVGINGQLTTALGRGINISTSGAIVEEFLTCVGNTFAESTADVVLVSGTAPRQLTFTGNSFTSWGAFQTTGSYGALNITGASTIFVATGNSFLSQASTPAVATGILGTCSEMVVSGNLFAQCEAAINNSANLSTVSGNSSYGTAGANANIYAGGIVCENGNYWDKDARLVTGWGTPTGAGVVANFAGASATLAQCSEAISYILTVMLSKRTIGT
jgi:hypothetical protein